MLVLLFLFYTHTEWTDTTFRAINLHPEKCQETAMDINKMQQIIVDDPASLRRCGYFDKTGNSYIWTPPLHSACQSLHKNCVKFLLDSGSRLDQLCKNGNSVLHYIFKDKNYLDNKIQILDILQLLIKKLSNTNRIYKQDHIMYSDMIKMIEEGANEPVKMLLECGEFKANVKELDCNLMERNSPFIAAIEAGNIDAMKLLLMHGVKLANFIRYGHNKYSLPIYVIHTYQNPQTALLVLKIFRCFGGNLKTTHQMENSDFEETIMQALHSKQDSCWVQEIGSDIQELMDTPLSMQENVRLSIWKSLGTKYWDDICKLGYPKEIESYLKLEDL